MMRLRTFLGAAAGIVIMIAGYTFAGCFLYGGMAAGFAQIPGLTTEGVIGLLLFYVIGFAFEKAKFRYLQTTCVGKVKYVSQQSEKNCSDQ